MSKEIFAILGLGLFGTSLATTLTENKKEVIAIDSDMERVEGVADFVENAVQGDFTKYDVLAEAGVGEASTAIIAASQRLENTVLAILNLQKLGVDTIIAKTRKIEYREVLLKLGAHRVILPEVDMGIRIGNELGSESVFDIVQLDEEYQIIEFAAHSKWVGKTIDTIDFRKQYHTNIIAIRKIKSNQFDVTVDPHYVIQRGDVFVGLTDDPQVKTLLTP